MRHLFRIACVLFFFGLVLGPGPSVSARGPQGQDAGQAGLIAEIEGRLDACRDLIRAGRQFREALDALSPLTARVFAVSDRGKQMELAVEIFLLKGIAQKGAGDETAAVREFRSMFELSPGLARAATKNIYDPGILALLRRAEGREPERQPEPKPEPQPEPRRETPPPTRAAVPAEGASLLVRSTPSGAKILLDGADTGKTTEALLSGLVRGPHTLRLSKEFHADWNGSVQAPETGAQAVVEAKLFVNSYASAGIWGGPQSDLFNGPAAVAVSRDNIIYVADSGPTRLRMINAEGESQILAGGPELAAVVRPWGLTLHPKGFLFISDPESHAILVFDPTGRFVRKWGQFGEGMSGLNTPAGLAVDGQGNVLVADGGNGLVKRFTPEGVLVDSFGQGGAESSRLVFPRGVAVNSKGEIVVLDRGQVVIFGRGGAKIAAWGKEGSGEGEFGEPLGLAVDALDCVYVADSGNHRVQKFDPRGRLLCAWGGRGAEPSMLGSPCAVAVDGRGAVFVAERDNKRIQSFAAGAGAQGVPLPR